MSDRRPPDDPWSEVLEQVDDALVDAGVAAGPTREALLEGVRQALDALGRQGGDGAGPDVTVVEGGRAPGAPRSPREGPPLRVAPTSGDAGGRGDPSWDEAAWEGDEDFDDDDLDDDWDELGWPPPRASRVVVQLARGPGPFSDLEGRGRFSLPVDSPGQTLLRAAEARPYRIACATGALRISLDGAPAEDLAAGCSLDVEARVIRVAPLGTEDAQGSYVRLR